MPIDFSRDRWDRIKTTYRAWWAGELDRPLLHVALRGYDRGRPEPELPYLGFTSGYDLSVPAEAIVDRWDYELSPHRYLGDGFPSFWPNFGPGVVAAFVGGVLEQRPDTAWFHPTRETEVADLSLRFDRGNVWLRRVADIMRAAMDRWQGLVQVGMTDLGGAVDVLSTFRPSRRLLLDLCDHPEHVKRATWMIHDLWWRCFDELDAVLRPKNPGYTAWTPIFSETPYYILQCDFAYMIGPKMFDEFIKPELAATCRRLGNAFYHLDGIGQLAHLNSLLEIEELKGIQWVPGTGQAGAECWPEVYRKVHAAGKLIQVSDWQGLKGGNILDILADQLGSAKGIICFFGCDRSQEDEMVSILERYGAL